MSEATIKTINMVSGESIKSAQAVPGENIKNVLGIGVGGGDRFASQVNSTETLAAWWSPNGAAAGDLADGALAMASMGHDANPNIICTTASTGNWSIVADNISDEARSLMSAANSDLADGSNFIAIDSGTPPSSDLADCLEDEDGTFAGFAFFKNNGADWDSANYGNIFQWYGDSDSSTAQMGTYVGLGFYKGSSSQGKIRMSTAQTLDITGATYMDVGTWYFIGWRQTSTANFAIYVVEVGDDWSNADESSGAADYSKDGLTLGMAMKGGGPQGFDGWRWGPLGFFTSDIGESALQAIFEAIPAGH